MARNRMIKPEFWSNPGIGDVSPMARLLFIGMLNFADDEGKLPSNPIYIRSSIFPYDEKIEVESLLTELEDKLLILRYTAHKENYLQIVNFLKHQRIDKPRPSQIPNPKTTNKKLRKLLFDKCDGVCPVCGREMILESEYCGSPYGGDTDRFKRDASHSDSIVFSVDHIIPKSKGGTDRILNLQGMCMACNRKKGSKKTDENSLDKFQDDSKNIPRNIQDGSTTKRKRKEREKKENIKPEYQSYQKKRPLTDPSMMIAREHLIKIDSTLENDLNKKEWAEDRIKLFDILDKLIKQLQYSVVVRAVTNYINSDEKKSLTDLFNLKYGGANVTAKFRELAENKKHEYIPSA